MFSLSLFSLVLAQRGKKSSNNRQINAEERLKIKVACLILTLTCPSVVR